MMNKCESISEWISVKDRLPTIGQAVLFVNDIGQNEQDRFSHEVFRNGLPLITVKFGFVYESSSNEFGNYITTGVLSEYHSAIGVNGKADHITHWMPLPREPNSLTL